MADRVPAHMAEGVRMRALYRCEWCTNLGAPSPTVLHIHHRVTRGRGGPHDAHNMVALCPRHHGEAHEKNTWPWLIFGSIGADGYRGPDPAFRAAYPLGLDVFARELSVGDLDFLINYYRAEFPGASEALIWWHVSRTRDYVALDAPRGLTSF